MKQNHPFLVKARLVKFIRQFFWEQDFVEIQTPVLNHNLPLEPNLYAFETNWQTMVGSKPLYLATSPEAALKKMLAQGLEKVFAIGHSFRNLEPADTEHNPEFLMLEWYRTDADYQDIMLDIKTLITTVFKQLQLTTLAEQLQLNQDWPVYSLDQLFTKKFNHSLKQLQPLTAIKNLAKSFHYETANATWEQLFNQIFMNQIEPNLGKTPFFLVDFPAQISPLCQPKSDNPHLAKRFEFYLNGLEIANGNSEQTDPQIVQQHFEQERQYRRQQNLPTAPLDHKFIQALEKLQQSGHTYAGVGLGIERLAMLAANQEALSNINPFVL
jgi:lysyl-tRNA synthetase class 2